MSAHATSSRTARALAAGAVALLLVCLAPAAPAAAMADPIWVRFESARAEPSALALRRFRSREAADARRPAAGLHGLLLAPAGTGPYPAVVLMHDCRGVRGNHRSWANWFASSGYVTLLVDSYFGRNAINVCDWGPDGSVAQSVGGRVFDAFGAAAYLARDARVDPRRIAVVSWGNSVAISATAENGARRLVAQRFRAGVAIGADCALEGDRRSAPLLLVAPQRNDRSRPGRCASFARRAGHGPEVRVERLHGAYFGFDDPQLGQGALLPTAYNPWSSPTRGVELRYDEDAHRRSVDAVAAFLHRHLELADLPGAARLDRGYPAGSWVVDPNRPGPDRPGAGASVFDALLARWRAGGEDVPFPLSRLAQALRPLAGVDETGLSGLKITFIPLGRSLQRHAGAPEFFRFPRVLLTVDGEPAPGEPRAFLRDQLFIGYQERAATLEVISFNPVMGRFEFQVVEGYDGQGSTRVRYANRTLCVSCHHNQAPMFPRAAWDETHDNTALERRLHAARPDLYGLQAELDTTPAARFDNATDRASDLLLWQFLWSSVCGDDRRCRGALLTAALQYRLSNSNGYDDAAPDYQDAVVGHLARVLRERHGDALRLVGADLPNRNPMLSSHPTRLEALMDPLTPRPVERLHSRDAASLARRWVQGTAERLPLADLRAVDAALRAGSGAERRLRLAGCGLQQRGRAAGTSQVTLRCGPASRPVLALSMTVDAGALRRGQVDALRLEGEPTQERLSLSSADGSARIAAGESVSIDFHHRLSGLSARLTDARRIQGVRWRWPVQDQASRRTPLARFYEVDVELVEVEDAGALTRAVTALAGAGGEALTGPTLLPLRFMAALREHLGVSRIATVCCEPEVDLGVTDPRPSGAARAGLADEAPVAAVQRFRAACGTCHAGDTQAPPGFLAGTDTQALSGLKGCAERIFLRLSMWQLAADERVRSPMPPASVDRPRDLETLRELAAQWYLQAHGRVPSLPALVGRGYDAAGACLPSSLAARDGSG